MDLSCIILSGDLELYVLGMLPEDEARKIEQLAILFPEVQEELDRISDTILGFANTAEATPSPSVKDNFMSKIKALKAEEENPQHDVKVIAFDPAVSIKDVSEVSNDAPVVTMQTKRGRSFLSAASIIGLVVSVGFVFYLVSQNNKHKEEIAQLNQQVNTLNTDLSTQQQDLTAFSQTLQLMQSSDYRKIKLTDPKDDTKYLAQVMWNPVTKEVYLSDVSLPETPSDKQYQLWAIVDGKPVDAGLLTDVKLKAQKMKGFEKAEMFAITLENKGGSPTPTLEAMYAAGKV